MIYDLFRSVLYLSLTGALAAGVIFLLKAVCGKRFSPHWHYVVWFLLVIKLAVPVSIPSSWSIFNLFSPFSAAVQPIHQGASVVQEPSMQDRRSRINGFMIPPVTEAGEILPGSTSVQTGLDSNHMASNAADRVQNRGWWSTAAWLWLAGLIGMVLYYLLSYFHLYHRIKRQTILQDASLTETLHHLLGDDTRRVRCVAGFSSPFIFGFFRPRIILPVDLLKTMTTREIKAILDHEMIHIKRMDHCVRYLLWVLQSVHWFNPVIWAAFTQMIRDCETACDAKVLDADHGRNRKAYASLLLDMHEKQSQKGTCPFPAFGEHHLKKRVRNVLNYKKCSGLALVVAAFVLLVLSVAVLTAASPKGETSLPADAAEPGTVSSLTEPSPSPQGSIEENEHTGDEGEGVGVLVEALIRQITLEGTRTSSTPYDQIQNNEAFTELTALGEPALQYMFQSFLNSHEDGIREFIMASACSQILGITAPGEGINTSSGREWFYKFSDFMQTASPLVQVDADQDRFPYDPDDRRAVLLPKDINRKDLDEVLSHYILAKNRPLYHRGEKAIEAHIVHAMEEKDNQTIVYLQMSFGWFEFQNHFFVMRSGANAAPVQITLSKGPDGSYEVVDYLEPLDGGMWASSIREMFPRDLAERVIGGDLRDPDSLREHQLEKARDYLRELGRMEIAVRDHLLGRTTDENLNRAIDLVTNIKREFPRFIGTREGLYRAGGMHPGTTVRCILETNAVSLGDGEYEILLSKSWQIQVGGIQPRSYWRYLVSGDRVTLMDSDDQDGLVSMIK